MITNQEFMTNDLEIATLKIQNEQLQNDLKARKWLIERMKTSRLGYAKKEESSSNGEKKNTKGKPTCHHCGKIKHTTNTCRSKNGNHNPKKYTKGKN